MKTFTINDMQKIAKKRGGECLSKSYINTHTKLKWRCEKGHVWSSKPAHIKSGVWCPKCGIEKRASKRRLSINEMQKIAKERGGECLSKKYVNANTKLKWQCSKGHVWEASPGYIKSGYWCPICNKRIGENICRKYFEAIFGGKFPKMRPEWLRNSEGHLMELDGYCEEIGIAFEYQGQQHYEQLKHWQTKKEFQKRVRDDRKKKELCKEQKVALICVPNISEKLSIEEMGDFIIKECKKNPFCVAPKKYNKTDLVDVYNSKTQNRIFIARKLAKEKGGKCLSGGYFHAHAKLKWQCSKGHVWEATFNNINRGQWCPKCGIKRRSESQKDTIEEMQKIAKERGGECLSKKYVNSDSKLKWRCEKGHVWEASPGKVKFGTWCPKCGIKNRGLKRRLTIEEMQMIAKKRKGKCLSEEYINARTPLSWRCEKGHVWEASPGSIKSGSWCPFCANCRKGSIEEMQLIAKKHRGSVLSKRYKNTHNKIRFRCSKGHDFKEYPIEIRKGKWCDICKKEK